MKKIFSLIVLAVICSVFTGCDNDEWGNGDPAMEHVYYFGFENWGDKSNFNNNKVTYSTTLGETKTLEIPVQFHSERVRSYDVEVYYYVDGMNYGTDYQVVDENGTVLSPNASGGFPMAFPQAKKGVKNVYIKVLASAPAGSFKVLTFDPKAGAIAHPDNIVNSQTKDYEVRAFTRNYFVTVNIK